MNFLAPFRRACGAAFVLLALGLVPTAQDVTEKRPVVTVQNSSTHPKLSPRQYEDVHKESLFLEMSDGVRLAADVFRPATDGVPIEMPVPLVWIHTRYNRAMQRGNRAFDCMMQPGLRELVRRGYAVAAVDVRGGGASFGRYLGPFSPRETQDAKEIMEWFVAQPWCDGNLGMHGGSYLGAVQLFAASTGSTHLKAAIPSVAPGDMYAFCWAGGIYRDDFLAQWTKLTQHLDSQRTVAPVGEGQEGEDHLTAAIEAHAQNRNSDEQYRALPFRDSVDAELEIALYPSTSPLHLVEEISRSPVAIYHLAGWQDCFTRDAFVLYANLDNPQRIAMGPWFHQQRHEFDDLGEHLRWYDRWLKGIDNGIDEEPPVRYWVMGAPKGTEWRAADTWPVPAERTRFYFVPTEAGAAYGTLGASSPTAGAIEYVVDYTTTSGTGNRWRNGYGGDIGYEDMDANDQKGISFTTEPFAEAREVIGHPVVTLWVSSTANDGDFFVYLEEVEEDGFSRYVTEGCLRASHRAIHEAPWDNLGLPWHRSHEEDVQNLVPGVPVELKIDLLPTAWYFDAGNRLRVTVTCADADNQQTPVLDPAPTVTLHTGAARSSWIEVPFAPGD